MFLFLLMNITGKMTNIYLTNSWNKRINLFMDNNINSVYRVEGKRIIYINGPITDEMSLAFNMMLLSMEAESPDEDISIYINSPGGSISAGLSMVDTMNLISSDVSTIAVGMAASMGAIILMNGEKGKRKILPHSKVMIHQPLQGFGSGMIKASDLENMTANLLRTRDELYALINECTGQSLERIATDCSKDFEMNAKEALEYGIVDEIVSRHGAR